MSRNRKAAEQRQEAEASESLLASAVLAAVVAELLEPLDDRFLGPKGSVYCYRDPSSHVPAREFLNGLPTSARSSYAASFTRHCNGEFVRGEHHHVWEKRDALWTYKHRESKTRILHTKEHSNIFVLLFGFGGKTENKVDSEHVNRAIRMQAEYKQRRDAIEERVRRTHLRGGKKRG